MTVHRSGNIFRSSRVTGPTQHFLSVEFDTSGAPYEIRTAETQELVADEMTISCLSRALKGFSEMLPIRGRYAVRRILVSQKDKPSKEAYRALLYDIIVFANEHLGR